MNELWNNHHLINLQHSYNYYIQLSNINLHSNLSYDYDRISKIMLPPQIHNFHFHDNIKEDPHKMHVVAF